MMDLDRFKGYNDRNGHPAGDELLVAVSRAIESCIRQGDRAYRYGGDEFAVILPDCPRQPAEEVARRIRAAIEAIPDESGGPHVTISVGVACHPDDATEKDALVETADQALFLAKGAPFRNSRDQFVAALDETAMALLDGSRTEELLDSILTRATRLLGVRTGYVYLIEPGDTHLTVRAAVGVMTEYVGYRLPVDEGIGGHVFRTGKPFVVDDYDAFEDAAEAFKGKVGAGVGVPLTIGGRVVGVLGLASGTTDRVFRQPEVDALQRFAQLASFALENARLHEQALSPHDPVTGLPTRVLMLESDADAAMAFAERVQLELKPPFNIDGRTWFISASMGIAVGAPGSTGGGDVLQEAEIALISAKRHPTLRVAMFDPLSSRHARERLDVEAELWTALERDELIVHYQPILDLRTSRIVGFEALARWQHPSRGLVLPVDFIALAEESELIVAIGRVILEKACRQAQLWRMRWSDENLMMSVNLSPRQFLDPDLANGIRQVLRSTGLEPSALELEITESSVMDRSETSLGVLQQLRALGVRIVLDDFGTGYSSLAYLRQLPLDTIKVDRSFVTDLDVRDPNVGIIRAVVSLAHGLGITVVAEGIETEEQARRLRELGCDMGQGYAWAHPAEPMRVGQFVSRRIEGRRRSRKDLRQPARRRPRVSAGIAAGLSVARRAAVAGTGTG